MLRARTAKSIQKLATAIYTSTVLCAFHQKECFVTIQWVYTYPYTYTKQKKIYNEQACAHTGTFVVTDVRVWTLCAAENNKKKKNKYRICNKISQRKLVGSAKYHK
jgi:hypothetical protein